MHRQRLASATLLSFAVFIEAFPNVVRADVVNLDEFAVVRNGITIFDDSFARSTTLNGGSGTALPTGTTFSNGAPANYFVHGSFSETTANNGQAVLNTANGIARSQPEPFIPQIQIVEGFLQTGLVSPPGPNALTPATTFSAIGLFDLAVPTVTLGTYDVGLTNQTPTAPGLSLQMRVRELSTGPVLQFAWFNMITDQFTSIDQVALTAAELADPQVELALSLDTAGSNVITASYAFGSGNTLATFNGSLAALASTTAATDVFTPTQDAVVAGFQAFEPVPEPSSLALLATSVLVLGGLARIRRRRARRAEPRGLTAAPGSSR